MIKTEPSVLRKRPPPRRRSPSAEATRSDEQSDEPAEDSRAAAAEAPSFRGTEVKWSTRTVRFFDLCSSGRWTSAPLPRCGGLELSDSAWDALVGGDAPDAPPADDVDEADADELRSYEEQGGWLEAPAGADDVEFEEPNLTEPLQVELDEEEPTPELLLREAARRLCSDDCLWWQGLPVPARQVLARAMRPDAALAQPGAKRAREEVGPSAEAARALLLSSGATGQCLRNWALAGRAEFKLELIMLGLVD